MSNMAIAHENGVSTSTDNTRSRQEALRLSQLPRRTKYLTCYDVLSDYRTSTGGHDITHFLIIDPDTSVGRYLLKSALERLRLPSMFSSSDRCELVRLAIIPVPSKNER